MMLPESKEAVENAAETDQCRIPVSGKRGAGKFALVDPEDFFRQSMHRWHVAGPEGADYPARTKWVNGKQVKLKLHREILGLVQGDGRESDHVNRNRYDARRSNLRIVTRSENNRNRRQWTWKSPAGLLTVPAAAKLVGWPSCTVSGWINACPEWRACVVAGADGKPFLSINLMCAAGFIGDEHCTEPM